MDFIEVSGKTVDEALTEALIQLGKTSDEVEYDVVEKGSSGFLGFNAKPAVLRVRVRKAAAAEKTPAAVQKPQVSAKTEEITQAVKKESSREEAVKEPASDDVAAKTKKADAPSAEDKAKDFLNQVFEAMHMDVEIWTSQEENQVIDVELKGKDMGVLIGKRGQTLDALQYLTNLVVNKDKNGYTKIKLDTENYRSRRKETLENLAKNIAFKVKRTKESVALEPMNPFERRVIHSALQGERYVETYSEGEEPYRHVIIAYKGNRK